MFPLVPRYAVSDLPGSQTYTQEEAVIYWETLQTYADNEHKPVEKRQRKRANVARYITEVIRSSLKEMPPVIQQTVTSNMTSHSLRRGAVAYANACPKFAIQNNYALGSERRQVAEFGQLITLRGEPLQHVLEVPDMQYNVPLDVVDMIYAALLMHMKVVLKCTHCAKSSSTQLTHYEYSLHRAVAATNARLGCHISTTM
ncbi:hypothetical protein PHPALM_29721 [Phytophthora palmivora]|uniref:Uncharacterized protein n=1 Tax=Phytophthora palmivora TaxID=4796 RepID=A0A2P4X6V3_9STRA|nr:hypothetical protein PHPALM_29721 [Phytophthora palmivora]